MGSKNKSKQSSSSQNVNSSQGVTSGVNMNYGTNQSGNYGMNTSNNLGVNGSNNFGTSFGSSGGSGSNQASSTQNVWGAQTPYLTDVYGQAQGAFNNAQGQIQGLTPEVQDQMAAAYQGGNQAFQNLQNGGQIGQLASSYGQNPFVDAMKSGIADDAERLKQQNLGSLDARAAASGMSGSSGYREQVGSMMNDVDRNAMNAMANVGSQAFQQDFANKMGLAQGQDALNQSNIANAGNLQNLSMAQFNPAMMGQQSAALYGQTIGGPTVLGSSQSSGENSQFGTNSSINTGNSFGFNTGNSMGMNTGFSNGMSMGMGMNGGVNTGYGLGSSTGQGSSSGWSFSPTDGMVGAGITAFSDVRLKENIKHVDQIDGINMYTWDWKDEEMSWPMNYGVIAQEVAQTHPDAVTRGDHGYLMVDYSKLGRAGEMALARMEG